MQQIKVHAEGSAETVHVLGNLITFLVTGAQTQQRFSMVEALTAPGAGSPPHLHRDDEEAFYVLEGTYAFTIDGKTVLRGPGSVVHVARGTPHAFANAGEAPARMLILNWPADHHERFFRALGEPVAPGTTGFPAPKAPDLAAVAAAAQASGIELLPPQPQ
ncbi:cupin domain-containing protein [Salinarimonas chemoclinalis]|uniref:cupin domain-containing protein n=1 Tax=Salinarimonas chemoclinalis TaxID=3241599 RepID=UPI0035576BA4